MPSRRIMTHDQTEVFLKFMEEHVDLATNRLFSKNPGIEARKQICDLWDELAAKLSSIPGGAIRPGEAWRRFWNEKKYNIRRKIEEFNRARILGKPLRTKVTDEDIRILSILNQPLKSGQNFEFEPLLEDTSQSETEPNIEKDPDNNGKYFRISTIQSVDTNFSALTPNPQESSMLIPLESSTTNLLESNTQYPLEQYTQNLLEPNTQNPQESSTPNLLQSSTPILEQSTPNVLESSGISKLEPIRPYSKRQLVILRRIAPKPIIGNPNKKVRLKEREPPSEPEPAISKHEGPPQWAIDIEERRTAATERIADSLEKLTSAVVGMQQSLVTLTSDVASMKNLLESRPP